MRKSIAAALMVLLFVCGVCEAVESSETKMPSRRRSCQRELVNTRYMDRSEKDLEQTYSTSFEDESTNPDWDGYYPDGSARDPGGF